MFQISLLPYYISQKNEILYARVLKESEPLTLKKSGNTKDTLKDVAIRCFAEKTGMFLNPIRFWELMTRITLPITESEETIENEDILMFPCFYYAVHLPHQTMLNHSQHVHFLWLSYEQAQQQYCIPIDKYALWELHNRLSFNKTDILPNIKATRPHKFLF